jgi:hypothetical protein
MTFKALTIAAAIGVSGLASSASAQTNAWLGGTSTAYDDSQYRAPYADARRAAYDNGYRDGLKRGEQAARDGRQFDVERERDYRSADSGYNRAYGDRNRYRDDYRGGFSQGYRDGYSRRGSNYPSPYPQYPQQYPTQYPQQYPSQYPGTYPRDSRGGGILGDIFGGGSGRRDSGYGAYQNGAGDGYKKGLEDLQNRRAPDVTRQKWYRSGDHDYDKAYGSKDAYRVEYRRGFVEGYNRAFREGRRY